MGDDVITRLVPVLNSSRDAGLDVSSTLVMHHGTAREAAAPTSSDGCWMQEGTHHLGDAFQRIFIEEVNRGLVGGEPFAPGPYFVRQEVNTCAVGDSDRGHRRSGP